MPLSAMGGFPFYVTCSLEDAVKSPAARFALYPTDAHRIKRRYARRSKRGRRPDVVCSKLLRAYSTEQLSCGEYAHSCFHQSAPAAKKSGLASSLLCISTMPIGLAILHVACAKRSSSKLPIVYVQTHDNRLLLPLHIFDARGPKSFWGPGNLRGSRGPYHQWRHALLPLRGIPRAPWNNPARIVSTK